MDIEMVRGTQFPVYFSLTDEDGEIVSTANEITMTCRELPYESSTILIQKKYSKGEIVYDPTEEMFKFTILEEDTKNLPYGSYGFDIKIEIDNLISKFVGSITITKEYTNGYTSEAEDAETSN